MESENTNLIEQETPAKKPSGRRRTRKKPAAPAETVQTAEAENNSAAPAAEPAADAPKPKKRSRKRGGKKAAAARDTALAADAAGQAEDVAAEADEAQSAPKKREPKPAVIPEGFQGMDISEEVLKAIGRMGFDQPTDIQKKTIPLMMGGSDIIGVAPTGTGKTLAFGIPMLEYMDLKETQLQELVLAPTRELAMQIGEELQKLAYDIKGLRIAVLYGGQPIRRQLEQLGRHPQIVVATPGRLLDHLERRTVSVHAVHTLVLDEADEMLNMGFVKDVCRIIDQTPPNRQFVMFSATISQDVMTISWKYQYEPVQITVEAVDENKPQITQYVIPAERKEKQDRLTYLLDANVYERVMIFTDTKLMAHRVNTALQKSGFDSEELHGDIPQKKRSEIMRRYKQGKFPILVCTDVAARGIDVDDVEAVINYDLPNENEYYLHRIGRTGRAHKHGVAFTLMTYSESVRMDAILKYMKSEPTLLHFDEVGILRREDESAFFENI